VHSTIQDVASKLFWLIASVEIALSIGFAVLLNRVPTVKLTTSHFVLARGQRQDNWLACAAIWTVILSESGPIREMLQVTGAVVLAWLIHRTAQRLRHVLSRQGTKR